MMNQPLVSILIPAKDESDYIEDCLQSIVNQTYDNWEAIIIDDHSSDNTYELVHGFCVKDSRFKCFKNIDTGIIPALRLALLHAKGLLITRMDADDLMVSDKIELLSTLLLENGTGHIATAKVKYFSAAALGNGYLAYQEWLNTFCKNNAHYTQIYKECPIPSPSWMMYRSDLELIGQFERELYPEDYDLIFRSYEHGLKTISVDKVLHHWRDYPTRSSRTQANYSDNRFLHLKMEYFLKLELQKTSKIVLWGAAAKGKNIAKMLIAAGENFRWICNNKNKYGHDIYGVKMEAADDFLFNTNCKVIIAVAQKDAQSEIIKTLKSNLLEEGQEYYLFC